MTLLHRILDRLRALGGDRRGNVLMLFAFSIIPLTFATGMGIDYSQAMRLETKLNAAADAAALASTTSTMLNKTMSQACVAATNMFNQQSTGLRGLTLDTTKPAQFTVVIAETYANGANQTGTCGSLSAALSASLLTPLTRATTVTFQGTSTNSFGSLLGKATLTVNGVSSTKVSNAPYIDIHVALDTSQSMGLPSTDTGAQQLWQLTGYYNGRSCQFGCHVAGYVNGHAENYPNEAIAKYFGISLRVNVESAAVSDMISTAKTDQGTNSYYRFGLYQFGTTLTDLQTLTTDLNAANSTVSNLTLGPNDGTVGYGDTNLSDVFNNMKTRITTHGDGATQARARAFLFVVTDGVQDLCGGSHCMALLDPALCNYYKNNNIIVGIVYTTYLPVKANPLSSTDNSLRSEYTWLISPLPPTQIAPQLQACASPGWYFEAADGATIHASMQKLFSQAAQSSIITR